MHLEVLTEQGKQIFEKLTLFDGFYLAGGTALALQIGHRQSFDFDLFSGEEIPQSLLMEVKRIFADIVVTPSVNNHEELTAFIDEIKLTFLYYPFPVILPWTETEPLPLLSTPELAATKAYTIGRRGSYKDYVDIYYILKERHTSLEEIIRLAEQKYGRDFNARLFLEQLIYLDDITDTAIVFLKDAVDKREVQMFFEEQVKQVRL